MRLALRDPDFTTAGRSAQAINADFGRPVARMIDAGTVRVKIAAARLASPAHVVGRIENIRVRPERRARVVVDQRSGTIVIGAEVRISQVAVAQGNLTLRIDERPVAVQPNPFAEGETVVVPRSDAEIEEGRGRLAELSGTPRPRRDLFHPANRLASVQTSRGCPMDCDFCSVPSFNGRCYRRRPPEEVLDELETIPGRQMTFFVDDNLVGYGQQARKESLELFRGMVERGLDMPWICQASLNFAEDEELLHWASRAGCKMVLLGLEAEATEALTEMNKRLNLRLRRRRAGGRSHSPAGHPAVRSPQAGGPAAAYRLSPRLGPLHDGRSGPPAAPDGAGGLRRGDA